MRQSIQRRSFLKYCVVGGAGLLADSYGWTGGLRAQEIAASSPTKFRPTKTLCGCFNLPSLEMAKDIGAQATRLLFQMANIDQAIAMARGGTLPPHFQVVKDLSDAGIPVIATCGWITKKKPNKPNKTDKRRENLPEPGSDEWKKWLETGRSFVQVMGPYLAGITLENEPITAYPPADFVPNKQGIVPAIEWFKALAAMIRETAPQLLISTPALNTLESLRAHPQSPMNKAVEKFFEWARDDSNIDVVDVHAHFDKAETVDSVLSYTAKQFPRGIILTEWSQAGRVKAWDEQKLDAGFAVKWKRDGTLTNKGYVAQCESNPIAGPGDSRVTLDEWNEFVATAPIDPNYMMDAFNVMKKHGVLLAAYGAAIQYGNSLFDIKQLYANLTVVPGPDGKPQPNYKFPEWFKAMAAAA